MRTESVCGADHGGATPIDRAHEVAVFSFLRGEGNSHSHSAQRGVQRGENVPAVDDRSGDRLVVAVSAESRHDGAV